MSGHHDHDHDDHDHDHHHGDHGSGGGPLERITHVKGGPPVLDVGDGIGAMVLLVDPSLAGTEVFVADVSGCQTHTGVWLRHIGAHQVAAAVFSELPEGHYTLLDPAGWSGREVTLASGQVIELDCRTAA